MSPEEIKTEEMKEPEKIEKAELKSEVLDSVKARLSNLLIETAVQRERRLLAKIKGKNLLEVCKTLREMGFDHLSSIAGVEYGDKFEVVYHLWSYSNNNILTLKVELPKESPRIASLTPIWRSADWHERETYDLMGIIFEGHPNLKRIFNPDDFGVHPLRKDFKLTESPWLEGEK